MLAVIITKDRCWFRNSLARVFIFVGLGLDVFQTQILKRDKNMTDQRTIIQTWTSEILGLTVTILPLKW